jgi:hypothetical protein
MLGADFTQRGQRLPTNALDPLLLVALFVLEGLIGGD